MRRGLAGKGRAGGLKQRGGTDQPDVIPGRVVLCCERATETARGCGGRGEGGRGQKGNGKIGEKRHGNGGETETRDETKRSERDGEKSLGPPLSDSRAGGGMSCAR